MARYKCKCGQVLNSQESPVEVKLHVYTDTEWDEIWGDEAITSENFPDTKYDIWRCPKCERIYVFDYTRDKDRLIKYYVLHSLDELKAGDTE